MTVWSHALGSTSHILLMVYFGEYKNKYWDYSRAMESNVPWDILLDVQGLPSLILILL